MQTMTRCCNVCTRGLDQNVFTTNRQPEPIVHIEDLEEYNEKEGLALSKEEMDYLKKVEKDLGAL